MTAQGCQRRNPDVQILQDKQPASSTDTLQWSLAPDRHAGHRSARPRELRLLEALGAGAWDPTGHRLMATFPLTVTSSSLSHSF